MPWCETCESLQSKELGGSASIKTSGSENFGNTVAELLMDCSCNPTYLGTYIGIQISACDGFCEIALGPGKPVGRVRVWSGSANRQPVTRTRPTRPAKPAG